MTGPGATTACACRELGPRRWEYGGPSHRVPEAEAVCEAGTVNGAPGTRSADEIRERFLRG